MEVESNNVKFPTAGGNSTPALPKVIDRTTRRAERNALPGREKADTHDGDVIAAVRRRLPQAPFRCHEVRS